MAERSLSMREAPGSIPGLSNVFEKLYFFWSRAIFGRKTLALENVISFFHRRSKATGHLLFEHPKSPVWSTYNRLCGYVMPQCYPILLYSSQSPNAGLVHILELTCCEGTVWTAKVISCNTINALTGVSLE